MKIALIASSLILAACNEGSDPRGSQRTNIGPRMMTIPADVLRKCLRYENLRPACLRIAPRTQSEGFDRSLASKEGARLWIFFAEYGAPGGGLTSQNAPPGFVHINVFAGSQVIKLAQGEPRVWGNRVGELIRVPEYPRGGMEGGHLIFRWNEHSMDYSISLHAWKPLEQAEAALRQMVESLP